MSKITLTANLPDGTAGVAYAKNHHWIELVDEHGERLHLPATALVMYRCGQCKETWFLLTNRGVRTCHECGNPGVQPEWKVPQLSFVPSAPSDFRSPRQRSADGDREEKG